MRNPSLRMVVIEVDGFWIVTAPWLTEPIQGLSWEEVYWEAIKKLMVKDA